jgi:tRNA(Ile)-lysidine synthase TilS/MesJ
MYEKIGMKYEEGDGYGTCLGHNKDDSLENVFSNIKKRRSYRNLYGMLERSEEDHMIILRPLLKIWKRDIIEMAHRIGIPYVYDSTPDWSERGKMRDILIPNMIHFDNEIVEGIFDMVNNFCEIYRIYERMIPEMIEIDENRIEVEDRGIYFYEYMKKIIYQICKKMKIKPIKNKSIFHISAELKRGNIHRITLSKECIVYKKEGWIVFIKK